MEAGHYAHACHFVFGFVVLIMNVDRLSELLASPFVGKCCIRSRWFMSYLVVNCGAAEGTSKWGIKVWRWEKPNEADWSLALRMLQCRVSVMLYMVKIHSGRRVLTMPRRPAATFEILQCLPSEVVPRFPQFHWSNLCQIKS